MTRSDFAVGIPIGLVAFYGLSLASAFWVARLAPLDYLWSLLLTAAICCALGIVVGLRAGSSIVASSAMVILVVMGLILGSNANLFAAPLPADFVQLFLHGARSPLVIGATVLIGAAGIVRVLTDMRQHAQRAPSTHSKK